MFSLWKSLNNFGKAVFLVALSVFVIFLAEVRADKLLRNGIDVVSGPVVYVFSGISNTFQNIGGFFGTLDRLPEENQVLSQRVEELESQVTELEELRLENSQLRFELDLEEKTGFDLLDATKISSESVTTSSVITINVGSNKGVEPGMPVIVSQSLLVGYVDEVFESTSRVVLLLDPEIEIHAMLQSTREDGIVRGQTLGQGLVMELIEKTATIEEGERIITSAVNETLPPGLLIGYVRNVELDSEGIFLTADVLPAVQFQRLEKVMVIKEYTQ
jgi:rod shape-determining protein MreC